MKNQPTTDDTLNDVIHTIGGLNLDSIPTHSHEQPGPSQKGSPKWLTKTLENVCPNEVEKIGTRSSTRQNGGDIYNSVSPIDMDISCNSELNLSTDLEPTSFKETASHVEWNEVMQKEYDALIKNGTWKLVDLPLGTKPIGCKWVYKNKYKEDGSLDKHKARLVAKGFAQKEGVDYEETFAPTAKWTTIRTLCLSSSEWMESPSDGCKNSLLEWRSKGESLYVPARRICDKGSRTQSLQTCKILVWPQASTTSLV